MHNLIQFSCFHHANVDVQYGQRGLDFTSLAITSPAKIPLAPANPFTHFDFCLYPSSSIMLSSSGSLLLSLLHSAPVLFHTPHCYTVFIFIPSTYKLTALGRFLSQPPARFLPFSVIVLRRPMNRQDKASQKWKWGNISSRLLIATGTSIPLFTFPMDVTQACDVCGLYGGDSGRLQKLFFVQ